MAPTIIAGAGIAAVVLHFLIRALKSGQMATLLAQLGLPSIPDKALPWISIGLGLVGGIVDALSQGLPWQTAMETIFAGLFAGTGAIAMHETVAQIGTGTKPSDPKPPSQ